jgi:hypothetical protein
MIIIVSTTTTSSSSSDGVVVVVALLTNQAGDVAAARWRASSFCYAGELHFRMSSFRTVRLTEVVQLLGQGNHQIASLKMMTFCVKSPQTTGGRNFIGHITSRLSRSVHGELKRNL